MGFWGGHEARRDHRAVMEQGWHSLLAFAIVATSSLILPGPCRAQVSYTARFTLEKQRFLQSEPIFCTFVIQNTGTQTFAFRFRSPDRVFYQDLEGEPRFSVTGEDGRALPDPAPRPCGGAKGTVVYGYVTLAPGQTHTEHWLLNQWARFSRPGHYHGRAERRLALFAAETGPPDFSSQPVAYAEAANEFSLEITRSFTGEIENAFEPYLKMLDAPPPADISQAVVAMTTLPQPFFLERLERLAQAPAGERRWDRTEALEGLARLGTSEAWRAIARIARGGDAVESTPGEPSAVSDPALRAYALLLVAEKGDAQFLPSVLEIAQSAKGDLRGDALRALGFFHDPHAAKALFDALHSTSRGDRVNAILGLKNLNNKDSIPALLATLRDPDPEVRQVANFALQAMTGQKFRLSSAAGRAESDRVATEWQEWWRAHAASFVPPRQPACHEW